MINDQVHTSEHGSWARLDFTDLDRNERNAGLDPVPKCIMNFTIPYLQYEITIDFPVMMELLIGKLPPQFELWNHKDKAIWVDDLDRINPKIFYNGHWYDVPRVSLKKKEFMWYQRDKFFGASNKCREEIPTRITLRNE